MRIRTFLILVVLLASAAGIVALLLPNRIILELPLAVGRARPPVWAALLAAFAAGIGLGLLVQLGGVSKRAMRRLRQTWSARHRENAARALETGRQAEREGRLTAAIAAYREAVVDGPEGFRALMRLGDALRKDGQLEEAISAHEQARRLDPLQDEAGHALALTRLELGDHDAARRELGTLIEKNPKGAVGPLRALRDLEVLEGRFAEAAEAARRLEEALAGEGSNEDDRAQSLGIRTELARARMEAGEERAASGALRALLDEAPEHTAARILLAELHHRAGKADKAQRLLVRGFVASGEPALLDALAELSLEDSRPDDAFEALSELAGAPDSPPGAHLALGRLLTRLERHDEAAEALETAYESAGHDPELGLLLADAEERRGDGARALELYRAHHAAPGRGSHLAHCRRCEAALPAWSARCPVCLAFGTVGSRELLAARAETASPLTPTN